MTPYCLHNKILPQQVEADRRDFCYGVYIKEKIFEDNLFNKFLTNLMWK